MHSLAAETVHNVSDMIGAVTRQSPVSDIITIMYHHASSSAGPLHQPRRIHSSTINTSPGRPGQEVLYNSYRTPWPGVCSFQQFSGVTTRYKCCRLARCKLSTTLIVSRRVCLCVCVAVCLQFDAKNIGNKSDLGVRVRGNRQPIRKCLWRVH